MESNARYGFYGGHGKSFVNDSYYGNGTAGLYYPAGVAISNTGAIPVTAGFVFVAPASYNFLMNNTAGEGALLENAADPSTFPRGTTANYRDIGAAQHQVSAGGQKGFVY